SPRRRLLPFSPSAGPRECQLFWYFGRTPRKEPPAFASGSRKSHNEQRDVTAAGEAGQSTAEDGPDARVAQPGAVPEMSDAHSDFRPKPCRPRSLDALAEVS